MTVVFILFVIAGLCMGGIPEYNAGVRIQDSHISADLDVGSSSDVFVTDWNGDGKKDMLVGVFAWGRICFYKNIGSNSNPKFSSKYGLYSNLKADGTAIQLGHG